MQIENTRAIITGGASGLGLAVAEMLVAAGGKVALFDVNEAPVSRSSGSLAVPPAFIAWTSRPSRP